MSDTRTTQSSPTHLHDQGPSVERSSASEILSPPGQARAPDLPPPDAIPGYQLLRELRSNERAATYEAVQTKTQRRVTIKVLNGDPLAEPDALSRFEEITGTLGSMEHPGIVTVLDSGLSAGARYFVSESVSGQPLPQYIAGGRRSISTTLRVFSRICDAVAAAHGEGIVHGNVKTGNILVDAAGEAYVLDFGIPAADAADGTASVSPDAIAWRSPECAAGGAADVRSDVYSLGVVLFQMLTGMLPFETSGEPSEVLDRIQNSEPVRPSSIRAEINHDVEAMVIKCLDKNPERRFADAAALASAVQKCLRPDGAPKGLDPFTRREIRSPGRNRWLGTLTVALVVSASGVLALSVYAWHSATGQARQSELQRHAVEQQRDQAVTEIANARQDRAAAIKARETAEAAQLDEQQRRIRAEAAAQEARDDAVRPTALARALTEILMDAVNETSLEPVYRRTVEAQRRYLGDGHEDVAVTLNVLARVLRDHGNMSEAETSLRQAMAIFRNAGGHDAGIAQIVNNLATILRDRGELPAAEALQRESLTMARKLSDQVDLVGVNLGNLAGILQKKGDLAGAEDAARQSYSTLAETLGEGHINVSAARVVLVDILIEQKKYPEAESLLLKEYRRCIAPPREDMAGKRDVTQRLAALYVVWGKLHEARTWRARLVPARTSSTPAHKSP